MKGEYKNWVQQTTGRPLEWVSLDEITDPALRAVAIKLAWVPLAKTAEEIHEICRYQYEGWSRWIDVKKRLETSPVHRPVLPELRTVAEASLRSMWLTFHQGKPPQSLARLVKEVEAQRPDIYGLFSAQLSVKDAHGNDGFKLLNMWAHGDVDMLKLYDRAEFPHYVGLALDNIVSQAQVQAMMVNPDVLSVEGVLAGRYM
jgi:hypothetical protein